MYSLQRVQGVSDTSGKPLHLCPNCSSYIIAAAWSERVSERCFPQWMVLRDLRIRVGNRRLLFGEADNKQRQGDVSQ